MPITDPRLRQAWPDTLYRTRICFTGALTVEVPVMVLALQGGMAVGKTTAARYVAAHAPDVTVFLEDNSPALAALRGRGLDKQRFADYCEIQRAFIQQEIDRYARAAACPCALVDLGPQEIEFYTLHYPASIGQDWPVEQVLAPELAALRVCRIDRTLFLQASAPGFAPAQRGRHRPGTRLF